LGFNKLNICLAMPFRNWVVGSTLRVAVVLSLLLDWLRHTVVECVEAASYRAGAC
jgi:hypothetical protein